MRCISQPVCQQVKRLSKFSPVCFQLSSNVSLKINQDLCQICFASLKFLSVIYFFSFLILVYSLIGINEVCSYVLSANERMNWYSALSCCCFCIQYAPPTNFKSRRSINRAIRPRQSSSTRLFQSLQNCKIHSKIASCFTSFFYFQKH